MNYRIDDLTSFDELNEKSKGYPIVLDADSGRSIPIALRIQRTQARSFFAQATRGNFRIIGTLEEGQYRISVRLRPVASPPPSPTVTEALRHFSFYARSIHAIDPSVNAIGVECSMRLRFGVLDHLSHEDFVEEVAIARACEAAEPGYLKETADSYGRAAEFERWEQEISAVVSKGK